MNSKYLPSVVCGFGAAVLSTVPGLKSFGFCLLVPGAAAISLFLHQKITKSKDKVDTGTAIVFGLFTGLYAAVFSSVFDIIITYFTHTNDFVQYFPEFSSTMKDMFGSAVNEIFDSFNKMTEDIKTTGFSWLYSIMIFINNGFIYLIFGLLGGLLGKSFINKKARP